MIAFLILGLSLLGVGILLNYKIKEDEESQVVEKDREQNQEKDTAFPWIFLGIGIFYLCGDLAYRWLEERLVSSNYVSGLLIIGYGLGILIGIVFRMKNWWEFKDLFVFGATTLFVSKVFLHFKMFWTFIGANIFLLFSVGLMDFLTLNYCLTKFKKTRILALLYAVITFSIFLGYFLSENILIKREEYILSFLNIVSLLTILLFHRIPLKKERKVEEVIEEEKLEVEEKLTPQKLMEKINSSLPSHAKTLTKREGEVLFYYVIENKNLKEISENLGISRSSVREYLRRISLKLGISIGEIKGFVKNFLENL